MEVAAAAELSGQPSHLLASDQAGEVRRGAMADGAPKRMLLQRWESRQSWCEGSGASRDRFASGDSPTHLSLTPTPGARGEQSAAGQEEEEGLDRGDSKTGLLGSPRKTRRAVLAGLAEHGSTTERLPGDPGSPWRQ